MKASRGCRAMIAVATLALAGKAAALDLSSVQRAAGVWELSRDDGARRCMIQLRAEAAGAGLAIGVPPGCRHAMPALARAASWTLPASDRVELRDRAGAAVLTFSERSNALVAQGPRGETYILTAAADAAKAGRHAPRRAAEGPPPVPASDIPGRYSILRDGDKDTNCMLTLHPGGRAQLAPACRDNGIVVFDPVGWSYAGGHLSLRARKGHHLSLTYMPDQSWQKDPKDSGKKIGFRKM